MFKDSDRENETRCKYTLQDSKDYDTTRKDSIEQYGIVNSSERQEMNEQI